MGKQGMASADPGTRSRVGRAGATGRAAALTPAERTASARAAANAAHTPAALARRIVRAWQGLPQADRAEVLDILREGGVN